MKTLIRNSLLHTSRICAVVFATLWVASNFAATHLKIQAPSPICRIQAWVIPEGILLIRTPTVAPFAATTQLHPIDTHKRKAAGGIFWGGMGVSFFGSWPIRYWSEPPVLQSESLITRGGFFSIRHWLISPLLAALYIVLRIPSFTKKPVSGVSARP